MSVETDGVSLRMAVYKVGRVLTLLRCRNTQEAPAYG